MNEIKKEWQSLYASVTGRVPEYDRDVVVTPYFGHYGLAGYVITVQGSPVHATAVFDMYRFRIVCLEPYKIIKINFTKYANTKRQRLYDATSRLIDSLGLPTEAGGRDEPGVYYLESDPHVQVRTE